MNKKELIKEERSKWKKSEAKIEYKVDMYVQDKEGEKRNKR